MKTKLFYLMILCLLGCTKMQENKGSISKPEYLEKAQGVEYTVTCQGICENQESCHLQGVGLEYVECNCVECVMVIIVTETQQEPPDGQQVKSYFLSLDHFLSELDDFVYEQTGESTYRLDDVQFSYGEDYYFIIYTFSTPLGETGTVMYLQQGSKKYEVDCHGTCSNPEETCRERFILQTEEVECTCEGPNCTMTITYLD